MHMPIIGGYSQSGSLPSSIANKLLIVDLALEPAARSLDWLAKRRFKPMVTSSACRRDAKVKNEGP